jgi:predicted dehydrogenase
MRRVLLVGAGEVGAKHLDALAAAEGVYVAGIADPAPHRPVPPGIPLFAGWRSALATLGPDLVVVAAPPGVALTAARDAAGTGAVVLVEKPTTLHSADLAPQPGDERIFVAFQPHFAPGLAALLDNAPMVEHAEVILACRRDRGYYHGWRRSWATAGGVLHQQAIHGLALALRLLPGEVVTARAIVRRRRGWAEPEDHTTAHLVFTGGRSLRMDARVDYTGPARHEVVLHLADGSRLHVRGRNLEAGLGDPTTAPTHRILRRTMYQAVAEVAARHRQHPCLFPLAALRRPLEVIDHVYRDAVDVHRSAAGSAA